MERFSSVIREDWVAHQRLQDLMAFRLKGKQLLHNLLFLFSAFCMFMKHCSMNLIFELQNAKQYCNAKL